MAWRPNESRNVETRIFKETETNVMAADAMIFLHHQAIHTYGINHTGQSSPCYWKILIYSCNFSMVTET